jgi:predicted double-glycine peptidase
MPPAHKGTPIKQLRGIPDVIQSNSWSCGAGAVQAVLTYYGIWGYQDDFAKALGTSEDQGTHPVKMTAYFKKWGLAAELREGLTAVDLRRYVDRGVPVIVDFQAWGNPGQDYRKAWEDGHYCIVVGYDRRGFYLEDPSLLGTLGYLKTADLEHRWHDYEIEGGKRRPYLRSGIVIEGKRTLQPAVSPID